MTTTHSEARDEGRQGRPEAAELRLRSGGARQPTESPESERRRTSARCRAEEGESEEAGLRRHVDVARGLTVAQGINGPTIADITVMRAVGTDVQVLTDGSGSHALPSWSPDGCQLV